jgi:hypothetical protein
MRAVWLAMRDEDPPDRGLTGLLAAARHKAEAMQPRPGAWQRLLAALRRPAMLALATVTVLIAGALLIGRRNPRAADPGLTASQDPVGPTRPAAIDPGAGSSSGNLRSGFDAAGTYRTGPAPDRPLPPAGSAPQPAAPPPAEPLPPDHVSSRPTRRAHLDTATSPANETASPASGDTSGDDRDPAGDDRDPAAAVPAPAPTPSERTTRLSASAAGADTAGGNNARDFARPPHAEPEASPPAGASNDGRTKGQYEGQNKNQSEGRNETQRKGRNETQNEGRNETTRGAENRTADSAPNRAADPAANGGANPARRPPPAPPRPDANGDLSRQCEAAALRGDCATVRRLVDRIGRTDRSYRARVAKDSPVGKCLVE